MKTLRLVLVGAILVAGAAAAGFASVKANSNQSGSGVSTISIDSTVPVFVACADGTCDCPDC